MASSRFDPRRLDVAEFATASGALAGELPLAALPRLRDATVASPNAAPAAIAWKAAGERAVLGAAGRQAALHLAADATLQLECQRCLRPVAVSLHIDRRVFFVEGEDAATALDAESDDDVLALSRSLDLPGLVEDELLLALPIVPRHEVCPEPLVPPLAEAGIAAAGLDAEAAHPFAVLASLKRGSLPN